MTTTRTMDITAIISQRNAIAAAALNADARYQHQAIGSDDGDINDMENETGMHIVHRAESDSDVAVYASDYQWMIVADANGPVAIMEAR